MLARLLRLALAASLFAPPVSAERVPAVGAAPDTLAVRAVKGLIRPDPLPSPLAGAALVAADGSMYVFGGWDGARWTDAVLGLEPGGRWRRLAAMPAARDTVAAVVEGRRILVAGGPPSADASAWRRGPSLGTGRNLGAAVRLKDGRILVAGGFTGDVTTLDSVEIYDPRTKAWAPAAPMRRGRYGMAFALLPDGRVLAAGGRMNFHNSRQEDTAESEIYDPATDSWTPTGPMREALDMPATIVLPDGRVMAAGGGFTDGVHTDHVQIFDPRSGAWRMGPPMRQPRITSAGVVLRDGRFLVSGGTGNGHNIGDAEVYDPRTGGWTGTGPMVSARSGHSALLLPDGRVLAAGGSDDHGPLRTAEVFDPRTSEWSPLPEMNSEHASGVMAMVGGKAVFAGGSGARGVVSSVEAFDAARGTWDPLPDMPASRVFAAAALLDDGSLLVAGGAPGGYPNPASEETLLLRWPPPAGPALTARGRETHRFEPSSGRWSPGPPRTRTRTGSALVAAGAAVFALGGLETDGTTAWRDEALRDGKWDLSGAPPLALAGSAYAEHDGLVYAAGGEVRGPSGQGRARDDLRSFDPATGSWTSLHPMPTPRVDAAMAVLGGRLYVVGGRGTSPSSATGAVEVYDPAARSWASKAAVPRPVSLAAAAVLDGRLYLVGGATAAAPATRLVQVYDPTTDSWTTSEEPTPPPVAVPSPPAPIVFLPPPAPPAVPPVRRFAAKSPERPHDFALVIGVGAYKSLPAADFAEDDAREMAAALQALGVPEENTVLLTGAKASLSEVAKYVEEWLPRRVSEDSRVYFYYSGHGAPDVKDGSAFLMPWDGDATFVKSTGFPLTRLYASLGALKAARVVAMIDSCFSGAGGRSVLVAGARPLVTVRMPEAPSARVSVLTAAESSEIAGALPAQGHGLFSWYLLQGLSGAAAPAGAAHLTLDELYRFVRKGVVLDARKQDREQTPTLISPDPGMRLY